MTAVLAFLAAGTAVVLLWAGLVLAALARAARIPQLRHAATTPGGEPDGTAPMFPGGAAPLTREGEAS